MIVKLPFPDPCLFPNAKAKGGGWQGALKSKAKARDDAFYVTKQAA